jgi:membrane-bound lytic murein transglycosylase D
MKKLLSYFLTSTLVLTGSAAFAQLLEKPGIDEEMLAMVDSNTIRLRGKLYPQKSIGDLNIYGFEETDVPFYADSVLSYRLSVLESEIPLEFNEYVKPYINLYTVRKRYLSSRILAWSKYYFPMFEEALDRANMPMELKYLAVIESALNPMATSPVGAAGMWQFMAPTGRMYGLTTTSIYDERRDVQKSTEAAIKYLRNSYRIYGDWLLVIASYNCGPGNVNKAIKRAGGVKNFWAIQHFLPRETRGYVPAFIAAAYMMNYAAEHNIYPEENLAIDYHLDTITVDASYNLSALAASLEMTLDELQSMNPALKRSVIPYGKSNVTLTVPYAKAVKFASLNDSSFRHTSNEMLVARKKQIAMEKKAVAYQSAKKGSSTGKSKVYIVKKGDSLGKIASKYNVSETDLKRWNHIKGTRINAGQKLTIKG